MSYPVKGQFNRPKSHNGLALPVLQPSKYGSIELIKFARQQGFDPFPDLDDPYNQPYWSSWLTSSECPEVLVSRTGIVAVSFGRDDQYRVLQQQWNFQDSRPNAQKYLQVWFPDNPYYVDSSAHDLHRLVGRLHCPYTEDCFYQTPDGWRKKDGLQLDHTDTDKSNNSSANLRWISKELNQRLRAYTVEDKSRYIGNLAVFDSDFINQ